MKTLVGMTIEKWAQSPVTSEMVRPYPVEKEEVILVFLDGSNLTVKEAEDGSGQVVWEWSDAKRPFSCRPKDGPMKVKISEDVDSGRLEILASGTGETVLLVSREEVDFCEEMFEKTPRIMEKRPVWIFAGGSGNLPSVDFWSSRGRLSTRLTLTRGCQISLWQTLSLLETETGVSVLMIFVRDFRTELSQSSLNFLWQKNI